MNLLLKEEQVTKKFGTLKWVFKKPTNLDKFLDKPIFLDKEDSSLTWRLPTCDNDKHKIK